MSTKPNRLVIGSRRESREMTVEFADGEHVLSVALVEQAGGSDAVDASREKLKNVKYEQYVAATARATQRHHLNRIQRDFLAGAKKR